MNGRWPSCRVVDEVKTRGFPPGWSGGIDNADGEPRSLENGVVLDWLMVAHKRD